MSDDKIVSLCVSCDVKGRTKLFRVADLKGTDLIPFHNDKQNIIHTKDCPTIGSINFWDWTWKMGDYGKELQYSWKRSERWIEYYHISGVNSLYQLTQKFIDGIKGVDDAHDYLFEFERHQDYAKALFCRGTDFEFVGNIARIKVDIERLYWFEIGKGDVATIVSPHYFPDLIKKYYLHSKDYLVFDDSNYALIYPPERIISQHLIAHIKDYYLEGSNQDRTRMRRLIDNMPKVDFITELTDVLGVSYEECEKDVQKFLNQCENFINGKSIEERFLTRMIENDSEVSSRFQVLIQKKWEDENQNSIRKLEDIKSEIHFKTDEMEKLAKEIKKIELEKNKKLKVASEINQKISDKLEIAKHNIAEFMSEYAIYTSSFSKCNSTLNSVELIPGHEIEESLEIAKLDELINNLQYNLTIAGVGEKSKAKALACYLLIAYYLRIPFIVAGFGAQLIIDALSTTLFCKTATQAYCCDQNNITQIMNCDAECIVAVHDALQNNNISKIINGSNLLPGYFCFVATTSDELSIETKDIYDYALPLFTKYFIATKKQDEFVGTHFIGKFNIEQKSCSKILLPNFIINEFAYFQCQTLMSTIRGINEKDFEVTSVNELLLQTIPIMVSLGKENELQEIINNMQSLSSNELKYLNQLCGAL